MKTKHVLLSALTAVLFIVNSQAQTVPSYVPTNGLVGWWPFNGNAIDESVNTNDGAVSGATLTTDRFGNSNKAYWFDGIDDVIVIDSTVLNAATYASISFWFQTNDFSTRAKNIFNKKRSINGDGLNFTIFLDSCRALVNRTPTVPGQYLSPSSKIISNWTNGVVVYNNGVLSYYINGILKGSITSPPGTLVGTQKFYIGKGFDVSPDNGGNRAFNGKIDDIGIWDRALTQQEITNLYNSSSVGLNEFNNSKLFSVYPNPAKHQINIKADASLINSAYSIYDYTGKLILSGKLTSENSSIELTNLAQGIYMLSVGDSNKQTFKLVRD